MDLKQTHRMSLFFRIMVFIGIYIATFAAPLKIEWVQNYPSAILIISLITYLVLFFIEAKSRINSGLSYDDVWRGCFWFSFWVGASLILPFIVFGVGPDGPIKLEGLSVSHLLANLICCAIWGGLAGLVGTVLINQFYGVLGGNKNRDLDKGNS